MYRVLIWLLTFQLAIIQILFKSKNNLVLETIELWQHLMIYQTKKRDSKNITDLTRSLLVALKRASSRPAGVVFLGLKMLGHNLKFLFI